MIINKFKILHWSYDFHQVKYPLVDRGRCKPARLLPILSKACFSFLKMLNGFFCWQRWSNICIFQGYYSQSLCCVTDVESSTDKERVKKNQGSHGEPAKIAKCLRTKKCFRAVISQFFCAKSSSIILLDANLRVNLLGVRGLGANSPIDHLVQ